MTLDKFSLYAWCKVPCSFVKFLERFFKGRLAVVAAKILCWAFIPLQNCFKVFHSVQYMYTFSSLILLMYSVCVVSMCVVLYIYRDDSHRPVMKL